MELGLVALQGNKFECHGDKVRFSILWSLLRGIESGLDFRATNLEPRNVANASAPFFQVLFWITMLIELGLAFNALPRFSLLVSLQR